MILLIVLVVDIAVFIIVMSIGNIWIRGAEINERTQ